MTSECPTCRYTSGYWASCKAATMADVNRLPEPFRSNMTEKATTR
jgi:hypothetical protein